MSRIKPRSPGGFQDYLPGIAIIRQEIIVKIKRIYERFGFLPLETHAIEFREVLDGNDPDFKMEILRLKGEQEGSENELALRFDLTVPLARIISAYPDQIVRPFKRYQIGQVWRGEKPQAGRFREFVQFDVDIVGSASMIADAEIVAIIYYAFRELDLDDFQIKINNRKILDALSSYAGFSSGLSKRVFRTLDKMNKIGKEGVVNELMQQPNEEFPDALGFLPETTQKILSFLEIQGTNDEIISQGKAILKGIPVGEEGLKELEEILRYVRIMEVPDEFVCVDLSIARGLEYYTGPVFETYLTDLLAIGSICSGGRYDGLVNRFSDQNLPATGTSIGVDRLIAALEELGKIKKRPSLVKVLVTRFDPSLEEEYLKITTMLRNSGINTEYYLGSEKTLKAQLGYAAKQEIPIVLIIGSDELEKGVITVRNMCVRMQTSVLESDLVKTIKESLNIKINAR